MSCNRVAVPAALNKLLKNPASISLAISKPAEGITQSAYMCHDNQKVDLVISENVTVRVVQSTIQSLLNQPKTKK